MKHPHLLAFASVLCLCGSLAGTGFIEVDIFDPGFLEGDCNYHSITPASNGLVYFTIGTHHADYAARVYAFDPETETIEELARLDRALGEDAGETVPHGKIHTPLIEDGGYLYFTTHTSVYDGNLPDLVPDDGREPYPGGHFARLDMDRGTVESLARIPLPNEGLITFEMDTRRDRLFALTWPSGILFTYDLGTGRLQQFGATQARGEWGQLGQDWEFICRRLGLDPDGYLYGSTDTGRIWKFDWESQRPVTVFEGLTLDRIPPVQEPGFAIKDEPHFFWRNWRTILWNPETESFWGIHGGSTRLFEFDPRSGMLRSVADLRVNGPEGTRRNPMRTQLGFTLGPDNTLYYLAHGPSIERPGRRSPKANVYLLTHEIDSGVTTNHGPLIGPRDRRVFFTESIAIDQRGDLYSVAWVETLDPERMEAVQTARGDALPAETRDVIYEIQLVRLKKTIP
jgi:hypothetical protein